MLSPAQTYDELIDQFQFDIPHHYNIGLDVCDKWADQNPDKTAIISSIDGTIVHTSFGDLKSRSNQLANYLVELGAKQGDRIGVLWPQSAETALAHIAIYKIGAIAMPLFNQFGKEALSTRLLDSQAKILIADEQGYETVSKFRGELPSLEHVISPTQDELSKYSDQFAPVETKADDPALLIYTSGTTGNPKGALHGHRVLLGHLPGVEMSHDFFPQKDDVIWTPADWAWIGGLLDVLLPALHHGVPVVAARFDKFNAASTKQLIDAVGTKNIFFPPTALRMLRAQGFECDTLRTVASGGEPLGAEMIKWGREALGLTINEFYGQTECNMVISSCSAIMDPIERATGKAVPGHQVAIVDGNGEICKEGVEGSIAIKRGTPVMMLEYWNNPTATAEKFRGDWLITGDVGIMRDGWIYFQSRDDDVITSAGYRIGPAEIENCLLSHECVAQVGVVGKADKMRTEIVKAFIVLKAGFLASDKLVAELQDHVKDQLAPYEYPREISFIETMPLTATGKIIRKKLREITQEEADA